MPTTTPTERPTRIPTTWPTDADLCPAFDCRYPAVPADMATLETWRPVAMEVVS